MFNHTAIAKALATAACTLAVALLTIGMGVNSSSAESDQPSGLKLAAIIPFYPNPRTHKDSTWTKVRRPS